MTVDIPQGKSKAFYTNIQDKLIYGYIDGYTVDRFENDFALFVELETGQISLVEIDELTVISRANYGSQI